MLGWSETFGTPEHVCLAMVFEIESVHLQRPATQMRASRGLWGVQSSILTMTKRKPKGWTLSDMGEEGGQRMKYTLDGSTMTSDIHLTIHTKGIGGG